MLSVNVKFNDPIRRKRRQLCRRILKAGILKGALVVMKRACGKPGCRCRKNSPHVSLYLSRRHNGKSRLVYIPKEAEIGARAWTKEYAEIKDLLNELAELHLKLLKNPS